MPILKHKLATFAGVALPLLLWEAYVDFGNNPLMPSPEVVLRALVKMINNGTLVYNAVPTLTMAFSGLGLAFLFGNSLGILAARSRVLDAGLEPLVSLGYPVPKLALYPILILAFGLGAQSKILQVAMECFFPIFVQSYASTKAIEKHLFWVSENINASEWRTFTDIIIPAILPGVFVGLRIAAPIMLIVITVTELIGVSRGLGFLISNSTAHFEPSVTWAVVAILGFIGYFLDLLIVFARRRVVFWESEFGG